MIYKNRLHNSVNYRILAKTISPVSIMNGEENLKIDPITGEFYIPGSSIAGAFRNYYEKVIDKRADKENNKLFGGKNSGMSQILFYDAQICTGLNDIDEKNECIEVIKKDKISQRPGIKIDKSFMTSEKGAKFQRKYLGEEVLFLFEISLNCYEDENYIKMQEDAERLIQAFANGDILLGNSKTVGFGKFSVISVYKKEADLSSFNGMINYLLRGIKSVDITESILTREYESSYVRFKIKAEIITPLLIKDEAIHLTDEPDGLNIKDSLGNSLIPGSSIKGALRAQSERIINTFPNIDREVFTNIFGKESQNGEGHISRLNCFDTKIVNIKKGVYNRIKSDYFTGGTVQSALMDEETVMGSVDMECTLDKSDLEDYKKEVGLLLLVLRDLCTGDLNLGGGYAIGRGYLLASSITLYDRKQMVYDFNSPFEEVEREFNMYIKELMN